MFSFNFVCFIVCFVIFTFNEACGQSMGMTMGMNETQNELDSFAASLVWLSFQNWNYTGPEHTVDGNHTKCPKDTGVIRCNAAGELTGVVLSGADLNGAELENQAAGKIFLLRSILSLRELKFDSTGLTGTIPHQAIGDLHQLHTLWLNDNNLQGEIPPELFFDSVRSTPVQLTSLRLHNNDLSGPIPDTVSQSQNLTELTLYHNHLRGSIPTGLSVNGQLQVCELVANATLARGKGNCFLCPLPADFPPVCGAQSSSPPDRRLTQCQTSCESASVPPTAPPTPVTSPPTAPPPPAAPTPPLPPTVGPVLLELTHATLLTLMLDRWNVSLSSLPLPGGAPSLHDIVCPQVTGPVLCNSQGSLTGVQLSGVPLTGQLENKSEGQVFLLRTVLSLHTLRLDGTGLSGPLPTVALGELHQLHTLHLNDNALTGPVPVDLFYDAKRSQAIEIQSLRLHNNELEGPLPNEAIANTPSLTEFTVYGNRLTGLLPAGLSDQMTVCDLGGRWHPLGSPTGNCFACPVPASLPAACNASSIACNWCIVAPTAVPPTPAPTYAFKTPAPSPVAALVPEKFDFFPVLLGLVGGVCITSLIVAGAVCFLIRRRRKQAPGTSAAASDVTMSLYAERHSREGRSRSASRSSVHTGRDYTSITGAGPVPSGQRRRSGSRSSRSRHASVSSGLRHPNYASATAAISQQPPAAPTGYVDVTLSLAGGGQTSDSSQLNRPSGGNDGMSASTLSSVHAPGPMPGGQQQPSDYDSAQESLYSGQTYSEGPPPRTSTGTNYAPGSNYAIPPSEDDGYASSHMLINRLREADRESAYALAPPPPPGHESSQQSMREE